MFSRVFSFWVVVFMLGAMCLSAPHAHAYSSSDLKKADRLYADQSYGLAAPEYARLMAQKTDNDALAREVEFKWADSIIRGRNEAARQKAEKTLTDIATGKKDDRWKAEAAVTLAHYYVAIRNDPWSHQQQIRDGLDYSRNYWARSSDLDLARPKFIEASFMLPC